MITDDPRHVTERVYDEDLAPHVQEIIRIATEHDVPVFLSVGMVMQGGQPGFCTTHVVAPGADRRLRDARDRFAACRGIVFGTHGAEPVGQTTLSMRILERM